MVNIGLYGTKGHQIQNRLQGHPHARIAALAGFTMDEIPDHLAKAGVRVHATLEALLDDPDLALISFCSTRKDEQGEHIIQALKAGKHVYAEKPCCMDESVLDRILLAARQTGKIFHEMGGTALTQPYCTLREIIASGVIGEVIQVFGQKSYPWTDWRPKDEREDGGLAMQVGVYIVRFAEHVAGLRTRSLRIEETRLGNTIADSDCRRAVSFLMTFENGAVGSGVANYCCPASPGWKRWGYETLRVFGEKGFVESIDGGRIGTLAIDGQAPQALDFSQPGLDQLELFIGEIMAARPQEPLALAAELSPTRWVIRARQGGGA